VPSENFWKKEVYIRDEIKAALHRMH